MKTVWDRPEKTDEFIFPVSTISDDDCTIMSIRGLTPDCSYEDRSVYININSGEGFQLTSWLQAEDAIRLGQMLVDHGTFALQANIVNHQAIHEMRSYRMFLNEGRIAEVLFEVIDENPVNHGSGYRTYRITPIWVEGMAPEYREDFTLDKVIYWSPFDGEFQNAINYYTDGCPYEFIGYDREAEVEAFNESVRLSVE